MAQGNWLEEIYQEHASALFRFLIRLTGNETETRDLLQEIFVRLAKSPEILKGVGAPRSYLFRLAHRLVIDRYRRDEVRQRNDDRAYQERETFSNPQPTEDDAAWLRKILEVLLNALPAEQCAVVILKVWEEMTFAEIAEALEISANTAASRYRYALDKLRDEMRPLQRDLP